jgi:hypothetical protein
VLAVARVVIFVVDGVGLGALGLRTSYDHELGKVVASHLEIEVDAQARLCDEMGVGDRCAESKLLGRRLSARATSRDVQSQRSPDIGRWRADGLSGRISRRITRLLYVCVAM